MMSGHRFCHTDDGPLRPRVYTLKHMVVSARASVATPGEPQPLYLSRSIVDLHGGTIHPEIPPDGGTRFVVRLPQ
jgi:K+-sensing histidine kinase KdpD